MNKEQYKAYLRQKLNEASEKIPPTSPSTQPQQWNKDQLYVKATSDNRYAGGSTSWLKIRRIEEDKHEYSMFVNIRGNEKSVGISKSSLEAKERNENLKFRVGGQPASSHAVLQHYYGTSTPMSPDAYKRAAAIEKKKLA